MQGVSMLVVIMLILYTIIAIVFSIAAYIALQGNPVGLVVPLIACAAILGVRYKFTYIGYNSGRKLATGFADTIALITEAASILGLTVVGALIPSVIKYKTDLQFTRGIRRVA